MPKEEIAPAAGKRGVARRTSEDATVWNDPLKRAVTRREAISTAGKAAIGVVAVIVLGGVAYYVATQGSGTKTTTTTTQPTSITSTTSTTSTTSSTTSSTSPSGSVQAIKLLVQDEPLSNQEVKLAVAGSPGAIGVSCTYDTLNFTQMAPTLTAMTAGNNIPYDLISIAHDQMGPYVKYMRSMDDLIAKYNTDLSVFTPALINQLYKRDKVSGRFGTGNFLGIPYISAPWGIQYNTKMYTDAGLVDSKGNPILPTTWDKFTENMKALTKPPVYGLGVSYSVWWNPAWMHVSYVASKGGSVLDSNFRPLINDANNVAAVQYWADAVNVNKFVQPAALTTDDAGLIGLFNTGGASNVIYWFTTILSSANDPKQSSVVGNVSAGPLPGVGSGSGRVPAGGWAHQLPQNGTNLDAAFKWAVYATTLEVDAALASGDISFVRNASWSDPRILAKFPYAQAVGQIANNGYAEPSFDIAQGSQLWTIYLKEFQNVVSGTEKAQAAMDSVYTQWDTILKGAGYYS